MNKAVKKSAGVLAAAIVVGSIGLSPLTTGLSAAHADEGKFFERTATYPVYLNHPDGESATTVAEISTVSEDGKTMIHTDALSRQIGFIDISDANNPKGLGTLSLSKLGNPEDEPTSVAAYGDYVFVVVNTSESYSNPSGRVDVVKISDHSLVRSIDLGGQPDSIAISPDGDYAAIAIENERDEEAGDGGLPQTPAGAVVILDLQGDDPQGWEKRDVPLTSGTREEPVALDILADAGLDTPQDPEPEYVTINSENQLALTLQENNGVVLIDLPTGEITKAFSAGTVSMDGVDTENDGKLDPTGSITDVPREPDAIGWVQDRYLLTANEGDWKGGTRGFTIFDSETGDVVWDAGNTVERKAMSQGLFPEARADKKGIEMEGAAVATFHGTEYGFVASERANFVMVYDLSDPANPKYVQTLPTTNGPEGVLPIPGRDMLAISSETDEAENGVRSAVNLFKFGATESQFPQLASDEDSLVPFGALSGLSANPDDENKVYAVNDNAYESTIYSIDTSKKPALMESRLQVTVDGKPAGLDLEGISARAEGGFWAAHEGAEGKQNALVRIDAEGEVQETVALPEDVVGKLGGQGLEGVTVIGEGENEEVVFDLQREVPGEDFVRIGKYTPATGEFSWYGYQLDENLADDGSWNGLSEITALPDGSFAVIERDKRIGEKAKHKAIFQFTLPEAGKDGEVPMIEKKLAFDVLPVLEEDNGRTQEKLEGLTVAGNGQVYIVTDNDALNDATGETVFKSLGDVAEVFDLAEAPEEEAPEGEDKPEAPETEAPETNAPEGEDKPEAPETEAPESDAKPEADEKPETEAPEADQESDDLADTGVNSMWLIPVGIAAVTLGAVAMRLRSRRA